MLIQSFEQTLGKNSIRLLLLIDDFLGKQPGALAWPGTDIAEPEVLQDQTVCHIVMLLANTRSTDETRANLLTLLLEPLEANYLSKVVLP